MYSTDVTAFCCHDIITAKCIVVDALYSMHLESRSNTHTQGGGGGGRERERERWDRGREGGREGWMEGGRGESES